MSGEHAMQETHAAEQPHPTAGTYIRVAVILTVLTVLEVGVFYVPEFHPVLAPVLLTLSAVKFAIVVMFYMHLKYDHRLFRVLFTGPLLIAALTLLALMFLFGHLVLKIA
jgi:cytochrome c oxidase subunit IV